MGTPAARITDMTATGDVIVVPGGPTVLIGKLPTACIGSAVTGAVCVGAVMPPGVPNVLVCKRPVAHITSTVTGINPVSGVPVTTIVVKGQFNVLV